MALSTGILTALILLRYVPQPAKEAQVVEFHSTYSFFVFPEKMLTALKHNGGTSTRAEEFIPRH
jgi:hypothetical protein